MTRKIILLTLIVFNIIQGGISGQDGDKPALMDIEQTASLTLGDFQQLDVSDDGTTIAFISKNVGTVSYDLQAQEVLRQIPLVHSALALFDGGQKIVLANERALSHSPIGSFGYETDFGLFFDENEPHPLQVAIISATDSSPNTPPDVLEVVAGYTDGQLGFHRWSTNNGYWSFRYWQGHDTRINHLVYDEARERLISSDSNGIVKAFSLDGELLWEVSQFTGPVVAMAHSSEVVAIGVDNQLHFLDISNGQEITSVQHNHGIISGMGFLNGFFVTGGYDGYLRWWSLADGTMNREVQVLDGEVQALAVAEDTQEVFVGASDGNIYRISPDGSLVEKFELDIFFYGDIDIEFVPGKEQLAITTLDGTLRLWSLTEQAWTFFEEIEPLPELMTVSADGHWLVIAYRDMMSLWEIQDEPELISEIPICQNPSALGFLDNSNNFLLSTFFGHTTIWDVENQQIVETIAGSENACAGLTEQNPLERLLTFTANEEWLVTGHADGNIRFWTQEDFSEIEDLSFAVKGPVFNLFLMDDQLLERNASYEDQIDRYDFALSGWSLTPDHERLWYYPFNNPQALLEIEKDSSVIIGGFPSRFSIITLQSLADADPIFSRFDLTGQASEIEATATSIALVVDNEIQIWEASSE